MNRKEPPIIQKSLDFSIIAPEHQLLPNGIPVSIINVGEENVIRLDLVFKAGSWQQTQCLQALLTNRMLREGTRTCHSTEIAEKLDFYGAWLELSCSSEYSFITLYSLGKYLSKTLPILASMVKEPVFPEYELRTVLDTNVQRFRINCTKVDFLARRGLLKGLYGMNGHPLGRPVEEEDYGKVTSEILDSFFKEYYHSGNCAIFISGKVDDEVMKMVTDTFGSIFGEVSKQKGTNKYPIHSMTDKRTFIECDGAMQSAVNLGMLTIDRLHPDFLKLKVLVTIFGGYFGSRLMSNIREDKGYTYGISAGISSFPDSSILSIVTETGNEFVELLIEQVYHEITRLHEDLISEEELGMVRNYMLGDLCRTYESAFSLSDAWIFIYTSGFSEHYFQDVVQSLREITPIEIRSLAQKYLCKESLKEVVAGKKLS